jgi:hypothetical protein
MYGPFRRADLPPSPPPSNRPQGEKPFLDAAINCLGSVHLSLTYSHWPICGLSKSLLVYSSLFRSWIIIFSCNKNPGFTRVNTTKKNSRYWLTQYIFRPIMPSSGDTIDCWCMSYSRLYLLPKYKFSQSIFVEMMVMALGETCWNKEEGYH